MDNSKLSLSFPYNQAWLPYVQDCLHRYGLMVDFSPALSETCTASVMEALEELHRLAATAWGDAQPPRPGRSAPGERYELVLDCKGGTVVMDIVYDARLPLNPTGTPDYEIPDAATDLDALDLDALWLHMIKQRMDRVHFMLAGSRHVLRMIKYRRDAGKEKQAWVMAIRPELRAGLLFHLDEAGGEHPSSLLQAVGRGVLKLGPSETFFVRNMDGQKSFHDLYMEHIDAIGLISPEALARLYEKLESLRMLKSHEEDGGTSRLRRLAGLLIHPDFSIPRADKVAAWLHRRFCFLCAPWQSWLMVGLAVSGLVPVLLHHQRFLHVISGLEQTLFDDPWVLAPVYLFMLVHVAMHELGHGIACKHYGGLVPRIGLMFYMASFIFYCDTTAALNFPRKGQRILVSLGGPIASSAVLGLALWGAGLSAGFGAEAAGPWESVFVTFSLLCLLSLAMNFNPFLKMDAYYILVDYTGVPNLRARSFKFLESKILGWLGLGTEEAEKATLRERRLFWWYGTLGSVATVLFVAFPVYRLAHLLRSRSASGGALLLAVAVGAVMVARLGTLAYGKIRKARYREYKIK